MTTHRQDDGLLPCPFCGKPPGTKVGPPAMARCITHGCEGKTLAAVPVAYWNTRATPASRAEGTDGWQIVPKEPTLEMQKAGYEALKLFFPDAGAPIGHYRIYEAMLAVAPEPVVRDSNMFARLAHEPLAMIPEGCSAPLDFRTAAEIEHDRLARKSTPPKPAPDALREALHAMTLYARAVVKVVMDRSPDGKVPKHLDALLSDATEKSKAAHSPAPVPCGCYFGQCRDSTLPNCRDALIAKRKASENDSPAPVPPADGVLHIHNAVLLVDAYESNGQIGRKEANKLRETLWGRPFDDAIRNALAPLPAGAAEAWPAHPGATVDAVAFVEGVKRYPSVDRDVPDLSYADKQAACQIAFIDGFKRAMEMRAPPLRGEREALVPPVKRVECVKGFLHEEAADPEWRVEVNGVCADFPTEAWANAFRNAILSLQSGAGKGER